MVSSLYGRPYFVFWPCASHTPTLSLSLSLSTLLSSALLCMFNVSAAAGGTGGGNKTLELNALTVGWLVGS